MQSHTDAASIRNILVQQLCKPVRWTETIHSLASAGVTHVVECGPGKVLSGLNKRIDERLQSLALTDTESLHQAVSILG